MAQYVTISCNTTLCGFLLGDTFYGNIIFYIRGQHEVFKKCRTGQGTFEIRIRIMVSVWLESGLYMWF